MAYSAGVNFCLLSEFSMESWVGQKLYLAFDKVFGEGRFWEIRLLQQLWAR